MKDESSKFWEVILSGSHIFACLSSKALSASLGCLLQDVYTAKSFQQRTGLFAIQ
jgi:hypothetical protein